MLYTIDIPGRDSWSFTKSLAEKLLVQRIHVMTSETSLNDLGVSSGIADREDTGPIQEERFAILETATHKKNMPETEADRAKKGGQKGRGKQRGAAARTTP